jgi:hypothetical protein
MLDLLLDGGAMRPASAQVVPKLENS